MIKLTLLLLLIGMLTGCTGLSQPLPQPTATNEPANTVEAWVYFQVDLTGFDLTQNMVETVVMSNDCTLLVGNGVILYHPSTCLQYAIDYSHNP